jgi:poly(3-hydroxybutyrate) depolymerase
MSMLYPIHEMQRDAMKPIAAWSQVVSNAMTHPMNPWATNPVVKRMAAGYDLLNRLGKDYEKPQWGLDTTVVNGKTVDVFVDTVQALPFCKLIHFRRDIATATKTATTTKTAQTTKTLKQPTVLLVAPLSGHHATLLRDTVKSLIADHEVYVTDWVDARMVPVSKGAFHLDDYVAYIMDFIRLLAKGDAGDESGGGDTGVHLISVCQPTVPVLAAVSLMATLKAPIAPLSMTMMGGPIDPRANPTTVNNLATTKPFSWFEKTVIHTVPENYAGAGRRVYPGFLQHAGFVAMNPDKHLMSHWDYFADLVKGDEQDIEDAQAHRKFYDEYNAVLDLDADYYLDTIKTVFQEHALAKGTWDVKVKGKAVRVNPADIKKTALFTIEGELDDISGSGQTQAAHGLCSSIVAKNKQHFIAPQCGHYGIFSGRRWREVIYPQIAAFIAKHD